MLSRRDLIQLGLAAGALGLDGASSRALAQQRLTQADLLAFEPLGQVTVLHFTDIHGQLVPL
jgi:sulfur-oxidizing protein SoxB